MPQLLNWGWHSRSKREKIVLGIALVSGLISLYCWLDGDNVTCVIAGVISATLAFFTLAPDYENYDGQL